MTLDQITIFSIILVTFALFVWGKIRYDIVSIIALCALYISDSLLGGENSKLIIDPSQIFMGFGHPAVITVAAVLIISRALRNSGVVDLISRQIEPLSKYQITHISSLSSLISILSAIMNNVGALALMLPVALKTSAGQMRSPSIILMPLAFASILGGMITMIGTPPNIIISNLRKTQYLELKKEAIADNSSAAAQYFISQNINVDEFNPEIFGMLDFSPVGGILTILGVAFITLFGWRLIPKSSYKKAGSENLFSINEYITEIRIPPNSHFINKKIKEIEKITNSRLKIIECINKENKVDILNDEDIINEGNRFLIQCDPVDLKSIMDEYNLRLSKEMRQRIDNLKESNTTYKEVLVMPNSSLVNRGRTYFRRRTSNSITILSVARQNQPIRKRLENVTFKIGDVLLIEGSANNLIDNISALNLVPLAQREVQIGNFSKVSLALIIFGISIGISMSGLLPTTLAFIIAILIYINTGILSMREIYEQVDWPIIVLLGAMIPVSNALQSTGSTQLIAEFIINITSGFPIWFILGIIMILTMCLSDIINNAATALIMAPISLGIAVSLGVNGDPFLMVVAVGASCAFLTPIGHQCNALILGPGGYRFSDYWRMGLPLEIIIIVFGLPLILYFWPL